jgi:hypothetical protein
LHWPGLEAVKQLVSAGRTELAVRLALEASWLAGDSNLEEARRCREAALWLLRRSGDADPMLVAELHRRTGRYDQAQRVAIRALQKTSSEPARAVLPAQIALAAGRDGTRRSMVDVLLNASREATP